MSELTIEKFEELYTTISDPKKLLTKDEYLKTYGPFVAHSVDGIYEGYVQRYVDYMIAIKIKG